MSTPETTTTTRPDQRPRATAPAQSSGRTTAALVLGILSIPAALIPILGIALGVIALVLAMTARSDLRRTGAAVSGKLKAAIICASIGIGLSVVLWILSAAAILSSNS
jgi:hypothetical protein